MAKKREAQEASLEKQLWKSADKLRKNIDAAPIERVQALDYVLTPSRYVGLAVEEDDFDFAERVNSLKTEFEGQLKEESELNQRIMGNLAKVRI